MKTPRHPIGLVLSGMMLLTGVNCVGQPPSTCTSGGCTLEEVVERVVALEAQLGALQDENAILVKRAAALVARPTICTAFIDEANDGYRVDRQDCNWIKGVHKIVSGNKAEPGNVAVDFVPGFFKTRPICWTAVSNLLAVDLITLSQNDETGAHLYLRAGGVSSDADFVIACATAATSE